MTDEVRSPIVSKMWSNVESLLSRLHEQLPKAGDPNRPSGEWIASISIAFGAYLGEILLKDLGGRWLPQNLGVFDSLPALNVQGNIVTPCRKVSKRILDGPSESVEYLYQVVSQVIREGPPFSKS